MADLNPILQSLSLFRQQAGAAENETQQVYDALAGLSNNDVKTMQDIGANTALIDTTKQQAELEAQQGKIKKAAELGIIPGASVDILSTLAQKISAGYEEQAAVLDKIAKTRSISILENPLEWIIGQIIAPFQEQQAEAIGAKVDKDVQQYDRVNKLTQTAAVTQSALAASVTQGTIQKSAENIQLQAQLLSSKSLREGLVFNAAGIKQILEIKSQQLSSLFSMFNAQQSNERMNIEMENAARLREQWEWKKQEKDLLERDDNAILDSINKGGTIRMGDSYTPLRAGTAAANNAIALLKSNSPVGKQFQDDYLRGQQGILAAAPSQALDAFKTSAVKISPAQVPVRQVLEQALREVQALPGFDPKNRAAVEASINAKTREIVDQQIRDVRQGDENNIFAIPAVSAILKEVPELQDLPIVKKVLGARAAAGDSLNDPDSVFQSVAKAVQDGKLSYTEALDLPYIYQRGVALNLAARNMENFGITTSGPNSKYSYNTRITTHPSSPFAGKDVVDLTKVDTVARALNSYMAEKFEAEFNARVKAAVGQTLFPIPNMFRQPAPKSGPGFYPGLFDPAGYGLSPKDGSAP